MSDPRTYQIPTAVIRDCGSCDEPNTATDWDDIRDGSWSYEFECVHCGALNKDAGSSLDRGATQPLFMLWITGVALVVIGILGHWVWPLIIAGAWMVALVYIIRVFMGAKQGANEDD